MSNPIRSDPDLRESGETENKKTGNRMRKQKNGEKDQGNKIKNRFWIMGLLGNKVEN
jgi:hypothetical protein